MVLNMSNRWYRYYSTWSDNYHKFTTPCRVYSSQDVSNIGRFPDIRFQARNMSDACISISILNIRMVGICREDLSSALYNDLSIRML
jgi:hypothetical protein